jgi:hypothetical protein
MAQVEFTPGSKGVAVRVTFDSEPSTSSSSGKEGGKPFLTISPAMLKSIKKKS